MKPLLALLLFMATTTLFYFQPTPDPSQHLPAGQELTSKPDVSRYYLEVDYVTDPTTVNIP